MKQLSHARQSPQRTHTESDVRPTAFTPRSGMRPQPRLWTWNRTHTIAILTLTIYTAIVNMFATFGYSLGSTDLRQIALASPWPSARYVAVGLLAVCLITGAMRTGSWALPTTSVGCATAIFVVAKLYALHACSAHAATQSGASAAGQTEPLGFGWPEVAIVAGQAGALLLAYMAIAALAFMLGRYGIRAIIDQQYDPARKHSRGVRWMLAHPTLTGCWAAVITLNLLAAFAMAFDDTGFGISLTVAYLPPVASLIVSGAAASTGDRHAIWVPIAIVVSQLIWMCPTILIRSTCPRMTADCASSDISWHIDFSQLGDVLLFAGITVLACVLGFGAVTLIRRARARSAAHAAS